MLYLGKSQAFKTPASAPSNDFVFTVQTTTTDETFTMHHDGAGAYSYTMSSPTADATGKAGQVVTSDTDPDRTITFPLAGVHTITCTGTMPNVYFYQQATDALKIRTVESLGDMGWTSLKRAFHSCTGMTSFVPDGAVDAFDCTGVTTLFGMFESCTGLTTPPDVSGWNTSAVTSLARMFQGCTGLTTPPDVSGWNLSSCTEIAFIFDNCAAMTTAPDVSLWDVSGVTSFRSVFKRMTNCATVPNVSNWTTTALSSTPDMFQDSSSMVGEPDIDGFDVIGLTDAFDMFDGYNTGQLSSTWYNAVLVAWEAQTVQNNVAANFGDAVATGAGLTARQALINDHTWTFTDGTP